MSTLEQHHQDDTKRKRAQTNQYRRHNNNNNRKNKKYCNPKKGSPGILLSCEPGKELKYRRGGINMLWFLAHRHHSSARI